MSEEEKLRLGKYQRKRRLVLAVAIAAVFTAMLFGQSAFQPGTPTHEILEMVGILLIVLGIVGRLWCTLYIGGRKFYEIVTSGPYSISRNPLYVFSTLAAAGVGAQMGSIVIALGFTAICALAFHVVILREERSLSLRHGAEYAAYLARVPRFIPNFSLYEEGDVGSVRPKALRRTLLDGLVFLVALPVFELIDHAQLTGALPVLFRVP